MSAQSKGMPSTVGSLRFVYVEPPLPPGLISLGAVLKAEFESRQSRKMPFPGSAELLIEAEVQRALVDGVLKAFLLLRSDAKVPCGSAAWGDAERWQFARQGWHVDADSGERGIYVCERADVDHWRATCGLNSNDAPSVQAENWSPYLVVMMTAAREFGVAADNPEDKEALTASIQGIWKRLYPTRDPLKDLEAGRLATFVRWPEHKEGAGGDAQKARRAARRGTPKHA